MVLDLARKDKRGRSLDIDEFNRVAKIVNARVYAHYYKQFEMSKDVSNALAKFKVTNYEVSLTAGVGTLPSDYYELIGIPRYTDGSDTREVDVVTNVEYTKRQSDYLTRPTTTHPIVMLAGVSGTQTQVSVLPVTVSSIRVDYLKEASTPFLDYYMDDTTLEYTYIDADDTPTVPVGSTYRDGNTGSYVVPSALTVNFDWDTDDIPLILSLFVQVMGLQLGDEMMIQVGNAEEIKNISE